MLMFSAIKRDKKKLLAMTGLTITEFNDLLPFFANAYENLYEGEFTQSGERRERRIGGGRGSGLKPPEQKLLFILVYVKTYPLQVVMGEMFAMTQAAANQWIHRLLPVLQEALDEMGVKPERDGKEFAKSERRQGDPKDYIIDGTERRRQRPRDPVGLLQSRLKS